MNPIEKIQKAIYTVLIANSTLVSKVAGIHSHIPQNLAFPYINISDNTAENISNYNSTIYEIDSTIEIFDKKTSNAVLLDIMNDIKTTLEETFSVEGHSLLDNIFISSSATSKGEIWNGEIKFRFIIKKS